MTGLLYRLLLLLYPPAFRRRYGRQMLEDLREMRQRGDSVGWAFLDVLRTAPREWLDVAGGGSRQGLRSDWPVEHLGEVLRELRRSLRGLTRTPGYTLVVVATLGMGIGGTSAVFSWMEGLVLRPLPAVRNPSELFSIDVWARDGQDDAPVASYRNLLGLREGLATQARVVGFGYARLHVTDQGTATTDPSPDAWGAFVTSNYFSVLGVRPVLGRFFSPAERMTGQSRRSAVISDALWTRRFARDPRIVGRQVQIDGFDFQIIGVAPSDFVGTTIGLRLDVWLPVEAAPPLRGEASLLDDGSTRWLRVFGRFSPGLSLLTLDQHVKALWQRLRADDPPDARVLDATAVPLDVGVAARLKPLLSILLGITGFMLLAICSNVANLTLLRGARRDHEVAVLLALGAGRGRVAARVLSESAILAGLGVCTGVALAALGVHLLPALLPPSTIPIELRAPMDPRVLLFSAGLGLAACLAFALAPSLRAARAIPLDVLRVSRGGHRGSAIQSSSLIATQLALSLATLVAAGSFFHVLDRLARVNRGFGNPETVLLFPAEIPDEDLHAASADGAFGRLIDNLGRLPEVRSAALSSFVPLGLEGYQYRDVTVAGEGQGSGGPNRTLVSFVDDRYFDLMRIPIHEGRAIDLSDRADAQVVAVVNEAFVQAHLQGLDPLGQELTVEGRRAVVVGVAANGKYRFDQLDEPSPPFVYLAWAQWAPTSPMILVRVDSRSTRSAGAIRRTFARLFPSGVLKGPMWLDDYASVALFPVRLGASVLSALGGLAMGLAALGLYAIMAFRVAQRTREVGVRIAIGASRVRIIGMFILQGAKTAATGLLVGLPLGLAVQKVFKAMIPAFDPGGVVVYAWAVGFLLCVTLLASGLAARRASRILPADALRAE